MAEYYPLLAKAVGSLPNSTPDSRRVVYERARKALIGQLRTLHPPVPDEDIERESVELDRAIERIESELAAAPPGTAPAGGPSSVPPPPRSPIGLPGPGGAPSGSLGPPAKKPPIPALRPKMLPPKPPGPLAPPPSRVVAAPAPIASETGAIPPVAADAASLETGDPKRLRMPGADGKTRLDGQRPFAPQPSSTKSPARRLWIIPAGVGIVVLLVGIAAWKLRDHPEKVVAAKPVEQTQADTGKIVERVGDKATPADDAPAAPASTNQSPAPAPAADATTPDQAATPAPSNPEVPVAHRAALLIEAPEEPNKVKTFIGTVVWKLNNVSAGPSDAVGVAVEADVDLPEDKTKAIITFEKNSDASLPASHTIKVRFIPQPGSVTGDVKQISVPQMRSEDNPSGEALAGVTVPVVQNSFLVGLSPGNAETANLDLIKQLQWIDIPMLLTSGKIAKLTFEKGDSGQRDITDAIAAWQK